MTKILRLVGTDNVRVCGERTAAARSINTRQQLFELLADRSDPDFLAAVLADLHDVVSGDGKPMPARAAAWLTQSLADESDEQAED